MFRIFSPYLYVYYDSVTGLNFGATNLVIMSKRSGISLGRLKYIFQVKKLSSKQFDKGLVIRLRTDRIYKKEVRNNF